MKLSITIPHAIIPALLASMPKKSPQKLHANRLFSRPIFWLCLMAVCVFLSLIKLIWIWRLLLAEKTNTAESITSGGYIGGSIFIEKPPVYALLTKTKSFIGPYPLHVLEEENMSENPAVNNLLLTETKSFIGPYPVHVLEEEKISEKSLVLTPFNKFYGAPRNHQSSTSAEKTNTSESTTSDGYGTSLNSSIVTEKPTDDKQLTSLTENPTDDKQLTKIKSFIEKNMSENENQFWKQPDSLGFEPCLNFTSNYMARSKKIARTRRTYIMVVVSGGLNQQRHQIVDAVVIARILGAALVVPILEVNQIWQDQSQFSDIFDLEHFKKVLKDDVLVVSSLPSTNIRPRSVQLHSSPSHASPQWFISRYSKSLKRRGALLLRPKDGRLSKDLPKDLQKLKCKVAFQALRFTAPIIEIGNKLARRMWESGPYVALHLRLEKDVWVRTGCLPGIGPRFDDEIRQARLENPQFLTARSNMTYTERKLAGLCPLNAAQVARLLKGLGATKDTRIFWAGGEPLGGDLALKPLIDEFGHLYNKHNLAFPGELEPFANNASSLAAIDYLISFRSDVFMPSHGGNMARALQGHRAYAGFRKHITPKKREMIPYFSESGAHVDLMIKNLHNESLGHPAFRTDKRGRDVLAYPAPECMCSSLPAAYITPDPATS